MKHLYIKIIAIGFFTLLYNSLIFAQKDTTELEIGKKKLIIIDKKTQQENAIYNLEKGKETFEKEIANANKLISDKEIELQNAEQKQEKILSEINKTKNDSDKLDKDDLEENRIELERKRIALEKTRIEINQLKAIIDANKKKKQAFESGIIEIDKGIAEIEDGLKNIDKELNNIKQNDTIINAKQHKRRFNAHWAGFEFGLLNLTNKNQTLVNNEEASFMKINPEKTFTYGLNIFEYNIPITKYSFGLATGAGIRWNSFNLEQNVNLVESENNIIIGEPIDSNIEELRKNKLNIAYVKVPVVLEYQTPIKSRKLYFGAGIFGEIRAWSKQKQVYIIAGKKHKAKKVDDFQLSPFRYGVSARVGYGDIGFFVEYVLSPIFKNEKGPEVYPVMLGIRFVDF